MLAFSIGIIIASSIVIYFAGEKFVEASSSIGDAFHIPRSVKGATIDAISSSAPELLVAIISIISFHKFEAGIGALVGSAFFNMLVIPATCVIASPKAIKVSSEVIKRDGVVYIGAVILLGGALFFKNEWGIGTALIFLAAYLVYLFWLRDDTHKFRSKIQSILKKEKDKEERMPVKQAILWAIGMLIVMSFAVYHLTGYALLVAEILGIPSVIIGFTVLAVATSIPDTVVSVANAKKGNTTDAVANIFGSNIFDILIGISVPVFIASFWGPVEITFNNFAIIIGLLATTLLTLRMLHTNYELSRDEAFFLFVVYIGVVGLVLGFET